MRKSVITMPVLAVILLLCSTTGRAETVCDTVSQKRAMVERPRLLSSVGELGFKYNVLFGYMSRYSDSKPDLLKDLPPLKGLKYRTYTISCERDSCITSRSIIAVRCPKDSVLLRWVCKSIEEWETLSKGSLSDQESLRSSGEIVTYYINKFKERGPIICEGDIGWKIFEQSGCLVTDVWHYKDLCTLFTSYWSYSGCAVRTFESWRTVNTVTGKAYSLFDFIDKRDEAALIDLVVKYLWNDHDRWIDLYPSRFQHYPEWLKDCSGAALTKNGLIVYYHAPQIGCYADGQFNAVIPYEELKSLPHGLLMDIL
ncbi:MAG TPA: hypothetical protein DDX40_07895 [Rikenellaceae bacterium]|nr:hypothetical protein [Rikenellaceae bacterium]